MKRVVRVHFMDESFKAFGIDSNATAEQLRQIVVERIGLKEDSCFALFEKKDDWERCLEYDERPGDLMKQWGGDNDAKKAKTSEEQPPPFLFLFKKKIFLKDDEKELLDECARNLVFIQALANVIESVYVSTVEEALRLAGLQMQATYKDHNSSHTAGFLTANNQLKKFIPKMHYSTKKPNEWEALIFKEHQKHQGMQVEEAKLEYIKICKLWRDYGTTFFPPCKSSNNKNLPNKVIIGVNSEGIRLLKNTKNKELISEHMFTEICSWASSSGTFAFEFGNQSDSQKYTFETKHGAIIASTIQTYIDILVQMLKNGDDDDDQTQTGTGLSSEED